MTNPTEARKPRRNTLAGEPPAHLSAQADLARLPWQRLDWLLLITLLLLGGALRFYQLGSTPPGFQFDEAFNAIDAEQVLQGNRPLFLPANGGREVLYTYVQAGLIAFFGSSAWSFRLASALWGTAAVGAAFVLFRTMLQRDSRLIAGLTATALAISYWHIHFSHFGIRVITMPVLFSALFGCFWAGTHAATRPRRLIWYLLAGMALGASVWSNPTGRLAPLVLVAYVALLLWRTPARRALRLDAPLGGLLITGLVAFLVFLPLGVTFWQNPEFFFGHASEVSVFAERVSGERGALAALADNVLHVLGMFSFFGDREWTHGIPGRPILDWAMAIPFYIGVAVWIMRLLGRNRKHDRDADALWLLALWVLVMLAPSVLSDAAPNYSRTLPSLPAALLPAGLGLAWIVRLPWQRWTQSARGAWIGPVLAGALLAASLIWTVNDYFVRFPQMQDAYYAYDVDKADALAILRTRGESAQVYLSPLWAEHAPVRWMRGGSGIKTLLPAETLALPASRGAVYAYTGEEGAQAQALAARINAALASVSAHAATVPSSPVPAVAVEEIRDKYDKPLLWLVTLAPAQVADLHLTTGSTGLPARFEDAPTLLAAEMDPQGAMRFEWQAEAPTFRDLTAFAHYVDRDGNRVAQVDRIPGDGSFPTPSWSTGERVIDRLQPDTFSACSSGEEVRVVSGWYEYAADGTRRARLGAVGDLAAAGSFRLPMRPLREDEVAPQQQLDPPAALGAITLLGFTLHDAESLAGGAPFAIDLYYRVDASTLPLDARLEFTAGTAVVTLGAFSLPAAQVNDAGAVFCQRVRLQAPRQMSLPGEALQANGTADIAPALTIDLPPGVGAENAQAASSPPLTRLRLAEAPPPAQVDDAIALFADEIALQKVEIGAPEGNTLAVTLHWQATEAPAYPYVAFVQLLTTDGVFVAGSDVQPSVATQRWTPGAPYTTQHLLALPPDWPTDWPADLEAGTHHLVGGMYDALTLERLPARTATGAPLKDNLAPLELLAGRE